MKFSTVLSIVVLDVMLVFMVVFMVACIDVIGLNIRIDYLILSN